MALRGELIDDPAALDLHRPRWDALAVARGRPYCAPGWQLAWWQHARPDAARLRVVLVLDGQELVGVAPFFCRPARLAGWEHVLLAAAIAGRVEPLAGAGREREVAGVLAETLARSRPRPTLLRLSQIPADSPWPSLLRDAWPGGTLRVVAERSTPAPTLALPPGNLDAWLAAKSPNFRSQLRRARRALEAQGASFRLAATADVERDVAAFVRLHHARWDWRGGSTALTGGMDRMLVAAASTLVTDGRLRLASIDIGGRTIGSLLFLAAGGEVSYWNGGYDEAYARQRPSLVGLVEAIGQALDAGDTRLDLGPGDQEYKARLADGADQLLTVAIVRPRAVRAGAVIAGARARRAVGARLSDEQKRRARAAGLRVDAGALMRILHVTEASGSGTFEIVRTIAGGAAQAGHPVCVALGRRPETPEEVGAQFDEGVEVAVLPWASRRPGEQVRAGRALRALVGRWRPDVVHLHSAFAGVVGAATVPHGIALVYTPHGSPVTRHSDPAAQRLAYRAVELLVARRVSVVGAVSAAEAEVIGRALRPRALRVVPNGIADLDPGQEPGAAPRSARPLVVVVGRVTAQRRPAETAAILAGVSDLADVLWIGASADGADGPLRAAGIEMTGWLAREAALARLAQASVVIHWSAWDGLSLALLEALARDVVVVASDIPANAEVVGPRQAVATVSAATALARRVLLEPVFARELLAEQRARRERYGARRCVEGWLALYADHGAPGRARDPD